MTLWFTFNIIVPLLTLPFVLLGCSILSVPRNFFEIIKDGQLCMFSAALAAVSIYDISKHVIDPTAHIQSGAIFLISLAALIFSLMFAMVFYGLSIVVNFASTSGPVVAAHVTRLGWISISTLVLTITFVLVFRYLMDVY
jgi:hypothetical protein